MREDATRSKGISPLQKCTAAIRQLAYGTSADLNDEYVRIRESTSNECLKNFCRGVIEIFGDVYLRRPIVNDIERILHLHKEHHGFPGNAHVVNFTVNGTNYTKGYYLVDGIYPEWATIVKSFPCPQDPKRMKFKKIQEAARKDVERAFRVLQSRWAIIRGPARFWHNNTMNDIIYACIIMHNMIVENEGNVVSFWIDDEGSPPTPVTNGSIEAFNRYIQRNAEVRDKIVHNQLRSDLMEHVWEKE